METKEIEERLRSVERDTALLTQSLGQIQKSMDDISTKFQYLADRFSQASTIEACTQAMKLEITAIRSWIDQHKGEYAELIAEHHQCFDADKDRQGFWTRRAERVIDWAVPAIVLWLLYMYKMYPTLK